MLWNSLHSLVVYTRIHLYMNVNQILDAATIDSFPTLLFFVRAGQTMP